MTPAPGTAYYVRDLSRNGARRILPHRISTRALGEQNAGETRQETDAPKSLHHFFLTTSASLSPMIKRRLLNRLEEATSDVVFHFSEPLADSEGTSEFYFELRDATEACGKRFFCDYNPITRSLNGSRLALPCNPEVTNAMRKRVFEIPSRWVGPLND